LTFLVRDWQFEYETPYGFEGGEEVLSNRLQVKIFLEIIYFIKIN
jgi:hypothetical protein